MSTLSEEIDRSLREDSRGAVLLENLRRCVDSGAAQSWVRTAFPNALNDCVARFSSTNSRSPNVIELREMVIEALESLTSPVDIDLLRLSFSEVRKGGFDVGRVLTAMTLRDRYVEDLADVDSFGSPISIDPLDDLVTDPEFDQGTQASSPPPMRLRARFSLCGPNRVAFITDLHGWERCDNGTDGGAADRAAEYLGLAYDDGEPLVMLHVRDTAISDWSVVRRPTVFDALDHWWWICWKDDALDCGHTLNLAGLDGRTPALSKGGLEWVINDQVVDSSDSKVVATHLGTTERSTRAGDHSAAWKTFCDLLIKDAEFADTGDISHD